MELILVGLCLAFVIWLYFRNNPFNHTRKFMIRRFTVWFPLGMSYAFLYMARYNLIVSKNALGAGMSKESFGWIFGIGTAVYGFSLLLNGPLVDILGGKKGIIIACLGACLANVGMGIATFLFLKGRLTTNLTLIFALLYSLNMFFQSYGAVSIIKVKAYWFHVRERGIFGAIFGTLISLGIYFALDWGQAVANAAKVHNDNPNLLGRAFKTLFAVDTGSVDAIWFVFFVPAAILVFWALLDVWFIKDTPSLAKFEDFDTHDASSGEMHIKVSINYLLKKIFTNPMMIMISLVGFTVGAVRNGVLQWYTVFGKEVKQPGAEFFVNHWGLLLCVTGIFVGFAGGAISDKYFQSRRGPPAAIFFGCLLVAAIVMSLTLMTSPLIVGVCALTIAFLSVGTHALMSGTAAADFGGRKAAATATGITDGFVYLGSGVQSVALGYLTTKSWVFWPVFLIPFIVVGLLLTIRMWNELPAATRRYLQNEKNKTVSASDADHKATASSAKREASATAH